MKKICIFLFTAIVLFATTVLKAQSFTRPLDTAHLIYVGSGLQSVNDLITVPGSANVSVNWSIVSCNFPADWLALMPSPGICDGGSCYSFAGTTSGLWPAGAVKNCIYTGGATGDFHLQIELVGGATTATTTGTYYATARIANQFASTSADTLYTTFAVTWMPTGVQNVNKASEEVLLYPNPASNEINLVYDANADIKNIAVYNVIGKVMAIYKVTGNSANLDLESVPAGIYFVRLVNAKGEVVSTRKFTKQ